MEGQRRAPRSRFQLPTCYHEGSLEKRSFKDKISRKLWSALCGNTLFFYNNSKDNNYVEKLDLSGLVSLVDDPSHDRRLDAARLLLHLKDDDDVYLTAPSLEARELWKGYILSVVKLAVPTDLNLLPGQIHMLREIVEKEKQRLKEIAEKPKPTLKTLAVPVPEHYMSILSEVPECFHLVSRADAEVLLEKNQDKGNLLLRPSRDGTSIAVSTRQELNKPVFKHYKVTRLPDGGFAIAVDSPILCNTLHEVLDYLVEKTGGTLKPLNLEHTYEEKITYVKANEENGEKSLLFAPASVNVPPKLPPKPRKPKRQENIYANSSDEDEVSVDEVQRKYQGGAMRSHSSVTPDMKSKLRPLPPLPGTLPQNVNKELHQKLLMRRVVSE